MGIDYDKEVRFYSKCSGENKSRGLSRENYLEINPVFVWMGVRGNQEQKQTINSFAVEREWQLRQCSAFSGDGRSEQNWYNR